MTPASKFSVVRSQLGTPITEEETPTMVESHQPVQEGPPSFSTTHSVDSHRLVAEWMGRKFPTVPSSMQLVTALQDISHQSPGNNGSPSLVQQELTSKEEQTHTVSFGQPSDRTLSDPPGLKISSDQSYHDRDLHTGEEKELASLSLSPRGSPKGNIGLIVEDNNNKNRVVPRHQLVSLDNQTNRKSPSRLICVNSQREVEEICSPKPGPSGSGHRRVQPRVEPVVIDLSLSPIQLPPSKSSTS